MRVRLGSIVVSAAQRRAIRHYYGQPGLATPTEVRQFMVAHAIAYLQGREADWASDPSEEALAEELYTKGK